MNPAFSLDLAHTTDHDSAREFIVTRLIPAPRQLVFLAWANAKLMADWWGPHAFTNPVCKIDAHPGGRCHIVMRCPEGVEYPLNGILFEMDEPERMVMAMELTGHSNAWHPRIQPFAHDRAGALLLALAFSEEADHARLTVRITFPTPALREVFVQTGMAEGLRESLDSLSALVTHLHRHASASLLFTPASLQL